ncbi:hypothetical protein [Chitinophaga filiformis]|uniref:DKNYY family protein n=1 Tax=Chitinophaga filiformis TaxID=104663 RepID=A0ABY4HVZ1_CHIFI|nr:hypothetical protein [Chitinophaga filiformis]UPK67957.1 hypothetical protein MYF79_23680 [Chitinophaga filiformis]
MKIELNHIGDPKIGQLFIDGRAFNLEHHGKRIYPQGNVEGGVCLNGANAVNGTYAMVFDRLQNKLLLIDQPTTSFQTVVRLPEQLLGGPISDDRRLNAINAASFEDRSNFVVVSKTIFNRLQGALTVLDLAGDKYNVDIRLQELRSIKNFMITIPFVDFSIEANGSCGWYDKKNKTVVSFDEEALVTTPANVYWVQFPDWYKIDPIGTARVDNMWRPEKEWNDAKYINDVQMIVNPTATFQHISETYMAAIIKENRVKKGLPPERVMAPKQIKTKHRRL